MARGLRSAVWLVAFVVAGLVVVLGTVLVVRKVAPPKATLAAASTTSSTVPAPTTSTTSLAEAPGARLVADVCALMHSIDAKVQTRQTETQPSIYSQLTSATFEADDAATANQQWVPVKREVAVLGQDLANYGPVNPVPAPAYAADLADLNVICSSLGSLAP